MSESEGMSACIRDNMQNVTAVPKNPEFRPVLARTIHTGASGQFGDIEKSVAAGAAWRA